MSQPDAVGEIPRGDRADQAPGRMLEPPRRDTPRQLIAWTIAMLALAVMALYVAFLIRGVLLLVYVSGLFAIGFSPLVRAFERQRVFPVGSQRYPRWLAILTIYLLILTTLAAIALAILPPIVAQARSLWTELPELFEQAQRYLLDRNILERPITVRELFQQAPARTDAVGTVLTAITGLVGGVFGFITILILTFYLLIESDAVFATFVRLFPRDRRSQVADASREITMKVSAWLTGQLILAAVIGTTAAIGLWLLGIPYFYVLALIAAIGEMVPVIGPIAATVPGVVVALSISPQRGLAVLAFYVLQQQFENHVLVPKVMERQVGVSAVTVIIALLIGGSLLGIAGAILAVPTAAILQVIFQELTGADEPEQPDAPEPPASDGPPES